MPDTDETQGDVVEETPAAEVAATPAPQYITREDFDRSTAENRAFFAEQAAQQRALIEGLMTASRRPAAEPVGDLTDDQLQQAVDEGRMTQIAATRYITERSNRRFAAERIDPLQRAGAGSISSLTKKLALTSTDATGKAAYPYARKYEGEIDKIINDFSGAGTVVTPEIYDQAYRFVVGGHVDEIAEERHEQRIRKAAEPSPERGGGAGARSGRTAGAGKGDIPTPTDLFGAVGQERVDEKGGPDAFAKKLGYSDWKAYAELAASQRESA